ncbi:30S ribosomal protein S7 [Candidatus Pacearchaeota archaeon CG10_big_fil_rev_8_21_14_0_10_35_13]|nr:MAG: 30S ribosomal protein S7 [Candidatus Pacearchaeota archaeon CG10_big_fil_rev_8_21_14_0_10_35_13]
MVMKIFDLYDISEVKVEDLGLKRVIGLEPKLLVKSKGRLNEKYNRTKINVVEKLINYLAVPGHRGKRHRIITGRASGKYSRNAKTVIEAFTIISNKTKSNPVQVLIKAIENAAPRDEVTSIEYGGARYPQAIDVSPMRRLALALRNIVHGAYDKAFGKKATMAQALANELMNAAENSNESFAITKRNETEKQADSAR